ncbi:MAG: DNA translocase FtsK, partial [Betaproteobacteria bacterium]|nr:DNA translocase FtsK [Betaproteobacteria bacterium]
ETAGWSTAGNGEPVRNAMGRVGAWFADLLLYLAGLSAYLIPIGLLIWVVSDLRRLRSDRHMSDERLANSDLPRLLQPWVKFLGFGLLFVSCVLLEATRLRLLPALPLVPGGVLGLLLSPRLLDWMGPVGFTLFCWLMLAAGLAMVGSFSWFDLFESLGGWVERQFLAAREAIAARDDRKVGERALADREEQVIEKRKIFREDHPEPIHIEPAVSHVAMSERAQAERQSVLFTDLPPDTELPPLALLDTASAQQELVSAETLEFTSRLIEKKLADFGVAASVVAAYPGPVITRYEIDPATGVKGSQIVNLSKDLARALSLTSIRVVETIPGKSLMGLELPNARRQSVRLSEILGSQVYAQGQSPLTLALGKDIAGKPVVADLSRMPHLLVAGTTGSGKSVGINAMLLSLLYKSGPSEVRMIMIDPKMLEMSVYEGIPHLLAPVVTDMKQAANALNWCVAEMERRYRLMSKLGVRNLSGYNHRIAEAERKQELIANPFSLTPDQPEPLRRLPMIVVVIDELADMMMVVGKKVEELIARLAQKARAAGIHLILATQRPSVDVITGLIKANIPTRIAFQVSSRIDSRTILDQQGAEALLGQGDMLYLPPGSGVPQRVHGAFVGDEEVHRVVDHWKTLGEPEYIEGILDASVAESVDLGSAVGFGGLSQTLQDAGVEGEADPLYDQAVAVVLKHKRASISLVQRHLRIGYNRSARLLEQMEKSGLVSAMSGSGNRDILVPTRDHDEA